MDVHRFFWILIGTLAVLLTDQCGSEEQENQENLSSENTSKTKTARFITFHDDGEEVKIELEFTVPFVKIPIGKKMEGGNPASSAVEVSPKGLVTAGVVVIFLITVVPKLVQMFIPNVKATAMDGLVPLMSRIDEAMHDPELLSNECYKKFACIASNSISPRILSTLSAGMFRGEGQYKYLLPSIMKGIDDDHCSNIKCTSFLTMMKYFSPATSG